MSDKINYLKSFWLKTGLPETFFEQIIIKYSEPHRHYHTLSHLVFMFERLSLFSIASKNEEKALILSIFYHDYLYDISSSSNEVESAKVLLEIYINHPFEEEAFNLAYFNIIASSAHSYEPSKENTKIFLDLDLSVFGAIPEQFLEYEKNIREEYKMVPEEIFNEKRKEIMKKLALSNFHTETAKSLWGKQREKNLKKYL